MDWLFKLLSRAVGSLTINEKLYIAGIGPLTVEFYDHCFARLRGKNITASLIFRTGALYIYRAGDPVPDVIELENVEEIKENLIND